MYYLIGALWILACVLLGLYVRGRTMTGKRHYSFGLKAIFIFYLLGLVVLFSAIVWFK